MSDRVFRMTCVECGKPIRRDYERGIWIHTIGYLSGFWHYARPFHWTDERS
jgi:hypothetical protein